MCRRGVFLRAIQHLRGLAWERGTFCEIRFLDKKKLSDMTKMTVGAEKSLRRAIVERHRQQISVHGYRTDWASACCVKVFSYEGGMVVQRLRS